MNLYVATLLAYKASTLSTNTDIIVASDEARGKFIALDVCRQRFPVSDGYYGHQCHLAIVPFIIGGYRIVIEPINVVDEDRGDGNAQ